jgi:cell wall-associated NlpC family hydrolase
MRGARRSTVVALVLAVVAVVAPTTVAPAEALPSTGRLRTDLAAAQDRLDELEGIVGRAVDDYHEARAEVDAIEDEVRATRAGLAEHRTTVAALRASAAEHVVRVHKLGPTLEVAALVASADPMAGGERAVVLRRLVDRQRADLAALAAAETTFAAAESALAAQLAEANRRADTVEARRIEVEAMLAAHADEVAELERRLAAELDGEERRRREEAERRLAAAADAALAAAPTPAPGAPAPAPGPGTPSPAPAPAPPSGRAAEVAVQAALSRIGSPYRWAATGPDAFDCSGLVVWAYAQAGVSLPRTSRGQHAALRPIAREELRPGDLVFAGDPVHHVGIYLGDGRIVHAPQTGGVVSIRSMERRDLRGFARVG